MDVQHQVRSSLGQGEGDSVPEAPPCAGHQRNFSTEVHYPSSCEDSRGNSMRKVAPPAGLFRAVSLPWCKATIFWAKVKPNPVPFSLVEKKGENSRSRSASGIPPPWSLTATCTHAPCRRRRSSTRPPDGEASSALVSTLSRACFSLIRSKRKGASPFSQRYTTSTRRAVATSRTSSVSSRQRAAWRS